MPKASGKSRALAVDVTAAVLNVVVVWVLAVWTGHTADPAIPYVLGLGLGALLLLHRKMPVPVLLFSLLFIDLVWAWVHTSAESPGATTAGTPDSGPLGGAWIWPATVVFAATVLRGRLRWAIVLGVAQLFFAGYWQSSVVGLTTAQTAVQLFVEALWLAAVVVACAAVRRRIRQAPPEPARTH